VTIAGHVALLASASISEASRFYAAVAYIGKAILTGLLYYSIFQSRTITKSIVTAFTAFSIKNNYKSSCYFFQKTIIN
jgi:hypothetical protein